MLKLEQEYFFIDQKNLEVKSGILVQYNIDQSKYGLCYLHTGKKNKEGKNIFARVEDSLVFKTEDEAKAKLELVTPIIENANKVSEEQERVMNECREQVIGLPKFTVEV